MSLRSKVSILICLLLTVSIFIYAQVPTAHSWGGSTHQFITQKTDNIMPSSLSWFFTGYSSTIVSYCTKPDSWKSSDPNEGDRHFYDYDIPHGEDQPAHGVLPWAVEDNFNTFVQYLRENDWTNAAQLAGVIGHYIEDASMPLHATSDYWINGMHTTYESTVNYHLSEMNMDMPGFVPYKLDNIFDSTMQLLHESYGFTSRTNPDNLSYWLALGISWNDSIKSITENRLRSATQYLANIWYTGMVQAGLVVARGVEVSVSPSYQSGTPGTTLTYTVITRNIGNVLDNYSLENSDNSGWVLMLDNNLLTIPVGENRRATLRVTIPDNASPGTCDNITVTATSRADNTISDNASCIARAIPENAFTLDLVAGWNLIGFVTENTPENIFTGLTYYDNYCLYYFKPPAAYKIQNPTQVLLDNTGYWIWIDQDMTVYTSGTPPASRDIHLVAGWNPVHFPVTNENTYPNNIFTGLTYYDNYCIYYFKPPAAYKIQNPTQVLSDNTGYWVWIDRDKTVTVP